MGDSHRNAEFYFDRIIAPGDYSSAGSAVSRMKVELVHRICISTVGFMCLGDFFNTLSLVKGYFSFSCSWTPPCYWTDCSICSN
jgi:hypothetical protein